jgi:hypothetical protein
LHWQPYTLLMPSAGRMLDEFNIPHPLEARQMNTNA